MKHLLLSFVSIAIAAAPADAEPAWCKPVAGKLMHGTLKDALTSPDLRESIPSIVEILCHARPDTEEARRAPEVEAARRRVMKQLAMTEADWNDAAEWAGEHQGKLMSTTLDYDRKKAWSRLTPVEQFAAITKADDDASYVADAFGPKLSELGRFGFIVDCLEQRHGPVDWAICQPDIDQLDRGKIAAELRASPGSTGYERMALRLDLAELDARLVAHRAAVTEVLARDAAYQQVFATAAAGRKAWTASDAKLADLVLAMDDARITHSRRAYEGCHARTWPALQAAIAATPASKLVFHHDPGGPSPFERAAGVIVNQPNGYLAALAYVICQHGTIETADYLGRSLAGSMVHWPGYRGPRTTALTAIMNAGIQLDDRDARLEFPRVDRGWIGSSTGASGGGGGVIASIKRTGDTAVITFAKKLERTTTCTQYKTGNRIVQITANGTFIYESWCVAEKPITVNRASPPQTVRAQYADGLAPGMVVSTVEDVVTFAWAKPGAKQPAIVAGVKVR